MPGGGSGGSRRRLNLVRKKKGGSAAAAATAPPAPSSSGESAPPPSAASHLPMASPPPPRPSARLLPPPPPPPAPSQTSSQHPDHPPSWDSSAEDFGQKVDLTVRIREILRNYPEGLSILKELIQNADDAGARTVRFVAAEARAADAPASASTGASAGGRDPAGALRSLMSGPSLLAYNSARFTETDFKSIQRIGDSLKKTKSGTKTGRFGVGVNSTYHLTDVPMFASGSRVVLFDPQASYVPGINPANPGKMVDCSKRSGRALVRSLPAVFDPLRAFGCRLDGEDFPGTTFRFALRTEEGASSSRLSRRSHSLSDVRNLLHEMAGAAPSMLLFLKRVERIEIYDWSASSAEPVLVHTTAVASPTDDLRRRRSHVLDAAPSVPPPGGAGGGRQQQKKQKQQQRPAAVDYVLEIRSEGMGTVGEGGAAHASETWVVCNQLGGGRASQMAADERWAHMRLVPWAGVAARLSPAPLRGGIGEGTGPGSDDFDAEADAIGGEGGGDSARDGVVKGGAAYCFLPLPVSTGLPVHVNGYFELSSNRRDVWWDAEDMAGDGRARAMWNASLVADVAAPCYSRLLANAVRAGQVGAADYEALFPAGYDGLAGPWRLLADRFFRSIADLPVLHSASASPEGGAGRWVAPAASVVLRDDKDKAEVLVDILRREDLPLVTFETPKLRSILVERGACRTLATPSFVRAHFRKRRARASGGGALEDGERGLDFASFLLRFCTSDLKASSYDQLAGCKFVAVADGSLGSFRTLPCADPDVLLQLDSMGFTRLSYLRALADADGDADSAVEGLFQRRYESPADRRTTTRRGGTEVYLLCEGAAAALLSGRASDAFVDLGGLGDDSVRRIYRAVAASTPLNVVRLEPDMLAEVVEMAVPAEWRASAESESAPWNRRPADGGGKGGGGPPSSQHPDEAWFRSLWRYALSCPDPAAALSSVAAGRYCVLPTGQGVVCALSRDAAVLDAAGLDDALAEALVGLGVRTLLPGALPADVVVPGEFWTYVHRPSRDGVIAALGAAQRRASGRSAFDSASDETRAVIYDYVRDGANGSLSGASLAALRKFPIFRSHRDDGSGVQFVAPVRGGAWYALEGGGGDDRSLMNSEFLAFDTAAELDFLGSVVDVTRLSRSQFYRRFVLPQMSDLDGDARDAVAGRILIDLPSLCSSDPTFRDVAAGARFVPSAATGALRAPGELYDPEVPQLLALMGEDSFPNERYCDQRYLPGLRELGLRSSMSWDVVLECARSIERDGGGAGGEDRRRSAGMRGRQLLTFLDANVCQYFPHLLPKKESTSLYLFRKVNAALFEDPDEKRREEELRAERVRTLLSIGWMPVLTVPPHPLLPWPADPDPVAAPLATATRDRMWLVSYSRRLADGDVRSVALKKLFGWLDPVSVEDVAVQLKMMGQSFKELCQTIQTQSQGGSSGSEDASSKEINTLRRAVTSEVPRIYNILNNAESDFDVNLVKAVLYGSEWLWMGDKFVPSDHVAFSSPINATPYLYTVPPDLACFRKLLSMFGVRSTFGSSDYALVLQRMAEKSRESGTGMNSREIDLAVSLVQGLSDDVAKLRDLEIFAPSEHGRIQPASSLTYDDAPWLSKDMPSKKDLVFCHPKLSATVAKKVGAKSLRQSLVQDNAVVISFGEGNVVHGAEAFGQSESLTRRLKNIIEMYPEGPQQLSELVQNADDARATIVRFVVSHKQHGTNSLLGQKLSAWQGPSLLCYNDSKFSPRDFRNLASIGSASKLHRLTTTGRFGLGFNSVFHWTDVPSLVSGDHLVMFDPHAKFVPGATAASRGIKIRFANSSLIEQFPDQFAPYCLFGCDMKHSFEGTLFRFPFRTEATASESEISKTQCGRDGAIDDLLQRFREVLPRFLLFLRHVKRIEVYTEGGGDSDPVQLLYFADVTNRRSVMNKTPQSVGTQTPSLGQLRTFASSSVLGRVSVNDENADWNAVSNFVSGPPSSPLSKEDFYSRLTQTPESQLPRTKHVITVRFVDRSGLTDQKASIESDDSGPGTESREEEPRQEVILGRKGQEEEVLDDYLVCTGLGGGSAIRMACDPRHRDMKFLPWAGVAAHITRNGLGAPPTQGNAFCFLPLPTETGLPVHINGYFELSANRRDIWHGEDMAGSGKVRSEWNQALLTDAIAPLYGQLLLSASRILGPDSRYYQLWPIETKNVVWKLVRSSVYSAIQDLPLFHSSLNGGLWVAPNNAVVLDATEKADMKKLLEVLLKEGMRAVSLPSPIINALKNESCLSSKVTPSMVRSWFKRYVQHPSLGMREDAIFILKYCLDDLTDDSMFKELSGLPLVPLCNGQLGRFKDGHGISDYFFCSKAELEILSGASAYIIDVWTSDEQLNSALKNTVLHEQTNTSRLDHSNFVRLLAHSFPPEWSQLSEVRWIPSDECDVSSGVKSKRWLSKLWEYIIQENIDLSLFVGSWQMLATLVGINERTLLRLSQNLGVISLINPDNGVEINGQVAAICRSVGVRTLDTSVFNENNLRPILRHLGGFVQPPTVNGVMKALLNSFPADIDNEDLVRRVDLRFKNIPNNSREKLREFLSDPRSMDHSDSEEQPSIKNDCLHMLRALPIFQVYGRGRSEIIYSHLSEEKFLPPTGTDPRLLDSKFVKSIHRDTKFLELLGITRMEPSVFYELHVCQKIMDGDIDDATRETAVIRLLRDLPRLAEEDGGSEWINRISNVAFLPNRLGMIHRVSDLYDPTEADLADLLDDSMLPSQNFCISSTLSSLRMLGLRSKLNIGGVIESAKSIETSAASLVLEENIQDEIDVLRKRSLALLNFLDRDETISSLLESSREEDESDEGCQPSDLAYPGNNFIAVLNEVAWLPVELYCDEGAITPPRKLRQGLSKVGVASPRATRPKQDEWICSGSMEILSANIRSELLRRCFGWDQPVPIIVVASQVLELSKMMQDSQAESRTFRQTLATVIPRCYEMLNCHLEAADGNEDGRAKVSMLFHEKPWLWVGDRFVKTAQVAYDAPEHARPFLFSVPNELLCFDSLLRACGVRDKFSPNDFVRLSSSLSNQLRGGVATPKQIDLAVFIARQLSQLPPDEFARVDKKNIFLPSKEGMMYRAIDMMFDDAPWLSAIVTGRARARYVFVHGYVSNEVAAILGAKSLRDVLSAHQNGMVKIPCPRSDALAQHFASRNGKIDGCRVVLDLLEIAEMNCVKQVSVSIDRRVHSSTSLLHPCLEYAQGPALVVCFHGVALGVEELVKLTSPSKFYMSSVSGRGGCGGAGFPRFGGGLCGAFSLSDCLQVLSGCSLMFFDPNGEHFVDGGNTKERKKDSDSVQDDDDNGKGGENGGDGVSTQTDEATRLQQQPATSPTLSKGIGRGLKASGRNYGISHEFTEQFPDQFEPFFSLSLGAKEALTNISDSRPFYRGTIIRIPLRTTDSPPSSISDQTFDEGDVSSLISDIEERLPSCFLFTYHLQSISVDEWPSADSDRSPVLRARVSSSPIARRSHIDDLSMNQEWKKSGSKFAKLFKSSWAAARSSYTMQISHRHKNDANDVVDTYVIQTILAPPRLKEMACTEALKPLNLIPAVSLAACIYSNQGGNVLGTAGFNLPKGTLFVGLDTGIETGLPFALNAPVFLHELTGDVLLHKDDDKDLRKMCAGIRDVAVGEEVKTLALNVWNRQAITSAVKELIPSMLQELRDPLQYTYSRDPRLLYRFWPYYSRVCDGFKELIPDTVYQTLASAEFPIYLTEKGGFQNVGDGYFASQDYPFEDIAATFFQEKMPLFQVPRAVVEDLTRVGVDTRQLTPSMARRILKHGSHIRLLSHRPTEALAMLEFCLSDMRNVESFVDAPPDIVSCRNELRGLCLVPLSDGSVGSIGRPMIIASPEQQQMLPSLGSKFICSTGLKRLESYIKKPGFLQFLGLTKFGPQILSSQISLVLPSSWEGKDFVPWHPESNEGPSRLWIYQFWKEVPIWDRDAVQMFRRWPLLPTTSGELASCANINHILFFSPSSGDSALRDLLVSEYQALTDKMEAKARRDALRDAAEARKRRMTEGSTTMDPAFWAMGTATDENTNPSENEEQAEQTDLDETIPDVNQNEMALSDGPQGDPLAPPDGQTATETNDPPDTPAERVDNTLDTPLGSHGSGNGFLLEADSTAVMSLHQTLEKIRCPLLQSSFFSRADVMKILPLDRLNLTRTILATISHCMNYWTVVEATSGEQRLFWSCLDSNEYDQLILLLSESRSGRLSLMQSDLNLLKILPIFETLSGSRIHLAGGNEHFTIDASVNENVNYLPESLRHMLLAEKAELRELYADFGVQSLSEATLLTKFVLPEFMGMPLSQKEAVCGTILAKWNVLGESNDFVNTLNDTPFVKRKNCGSTEVVFVQASQLLDPRNDLVAVVFDDDRSCFPAEEFEREEWLEILSKVGLKTVVDKEAFLQCAWKIEADQSVPKAMKLLEHYREHFGDFFDSGQGEFGQKLAGIQCVPAEIQGGQLSLYKFCDVAVPKDRHIVFRVLPVIPESVCPPQVMFSTLGIVSPPTIATVLKQVRSLTEAGGGLEHWSYSHGTVDEVFCHLFSFLQENYDRISPRVQEGLQGRPLVPVGTTLVKANRLFFRLTKDLAPFFYEVPRAFGAYDRFLRSIGVRDSPKWEDYAFSLAELKNEVGDSSLNINELKSVIDVVSLVVDEAHGAGSSLRNLFAPDARGKLVFTHELFQNDCPWLVNSGRLNLERLHLAHPKLPQDLCEQLGINLLSNSVSEHLEGGFTPEIISHSDSGLDRIQTNIQNDPFISTMAQLVEEQFRERVGATRHFSVVRVSNLRTRFVLSKRGADTEDVDVTGEPVGSYCFIDGSRVLVAVLPVGLASELVIAAALCDYFRIDRKNVAGLSAMLASDQSSITMIRQAMGISGKGERDELRRGDPGYPLVDADSRHVELKPLKVFNKGEIVAVKQDVISGNLVYGVVMESGGGNSLSRLQVRVGRDQFRLMLSSDIYSIAPSGGARTSTQQREDFKHLRLVKRDRKQEDDLETSLVTDEEGARACDISVVTPVDRKEVLGAVQDLLQSAGMSLHDDVKNVMDSNLALKDQISQKDVHIEALLNQGKDLSNDLSKGMDAFVCPITRELMEDPVICSDGHTYERHAIEMWLRSNSRSPKTNQPLATRTLIQNHAMRNAIETMKEGLKGVRKFSETFK